MTLGKQAKTLSKGQVEALLSFIAYSRHPIRNRVIALLSLWAQKETTSRQPGPPRLCRNRFSSRLIHYQYTLFP